MGLPKLTIDRANEKLNQNSRPIKCVGPINGYQNKTKWQCKICTQTWDSSPHVVLTCKHGCPHCQTMNSENVDKRLALSSHIKRIDEIYQIKEKSRFECLKCGNVWTTNANSILNARTGCPSCSQKQKLTNEIVDTRLKEQQHRINRIGNVTTTHAKIEWKCEFNHDWLASPVSIFSHKTGCPVCYSKNGGRGIPVVYNNIWFRSTLEANVYKELIKIIKPEEVVTQKRYNNRTKHTCDFYVPYYNLWIEVSNYVDSKYIKTINKKRRWISKLGEDFIFIKHPTEIPQWWRDAYQMI